MSGPTFRVFVKACATSASVLAMAAGVAHADRRNPAPIVYAGQANPNTVQPQTTQPSATRVQTDSAGRIVFQYPGSPAPEAAAPVEQKFAALPTTDYRAASKSPVIEDAMPEPSAFTGTPVSKPIRIAASRPETPAAVGKPLTLSRVKAQSNTPIGEETGRAGVYTEGFDGQPTANGEVFDSEAMTAAHPTLPLPSLVQVTNKQNGREIVVRVNDRGPFAGGRILDLSRRAARTIGLQEGQTAQVELRYLGPAPVKQVADAAASVPVVETPLAPLRPRPREEKVAAYPAPNLGVPDPIEVSAPELDGGSANIFIQAGSFADIGNAQRLTDALGRRLPVEIQQARVRNADYFRVMIGPFASRHEAETYRDHLSQAGIVQGLIVEK